MTESPPHHVLEMGKLFAMDVTHATLLRGGKINENWAVDSPRGARVLRLYPKGRKSKQVRFEMDVLRYLRAAGQAVAQVHRATTGDSVTSYDERPLACLELLKATPLSKEQAFEIPTGKLSQLLVPIHSALEHYSPPFRPVRETFVFRKRMPALLGQLCHSRRPRIEQLFDALCQWEASAKLPTSVIHADIHPANILKSDSGKLYLIDFDAAHVGPRGIDWILPAIEFSWEPEGRFNEKRFEEIAQLLSLSASNFERSALSTLRTLVMLKCAATLADNGTALERNRYATAVCLSPCVGIF